MSNELPSVFEYRNFIELAVRGALDDLISADSYYTVHLVPFEIDGCGCVLVRLMTPARGVLAAEIFQAPFEDLADRIGKWRR